MESSESVRLTIVSQDRRGLLADSAAVLTGNGLSISHASASTWRRQNLALHSFIVEGGREFDNEAWDLFGKRLRTMVATGKAPIPILRPIRPVSVTVRDLKIDRSSKWWLQTSKVCFRQSAQVLANS